MIHGPALLASPVSLVRNAESQAPSQTYRMGKSGLGPKNLNEVSTEF